MTSLEIVVPADVSRELGTDVEVVASYRARRLEREFGDAGRWRVAVEPSDRGFLCAVTIAHSGRVIRATATSALVELAIWDAFDDVVRAMRARPPAAPKN